MQTTISRNTKYSTAVLAALSARGHLTNAELLSMLATDFPSVSATTIHRTTARLYERGTILQAPPDEEGSMRYDANTVPHDHFMCSGCGGIRDLDIAHKITPLLSDALGGCKITGRLVIHGSCTECISGGIR